MCENISGQSKGRKGMLNSKALKEKGYKFKKSK